MKKLTRSRWAAIGAAVAVTLGGGGLIGVSAAETSSTLTPVSPVRVVDTRPTGKVGNIADGASITVQITGAIKTVNEGTKTVVPDGSSAIIGNLTLVETHANDYGGFATVYPCGDRPEASNVNFTSGQTIANSVAVPLSTTGTVCIYVYGTAHVLFDISGYYTTSEISEVAARVSSIETDITEVQEKTDEQATKITEVEQRVIEVAEEPKEAETSVEPAVLYDESGTEYPVYQATRAGYKQATWLSLPSNGAYLLLEDTYWPIDAEGLRYNYTFHIPFFASSDCSGDHYLSYSGVPTSSLEVEFDWADTVSTPLLVEGDGRMNLFPLGEIFQIEIETTDIPDQTELKSRFDLGNCISNGFVSTGEFVRAVASEPSVTIPTLSAVQP